VAPEEGEAEAEAEDGRRQKVKAIPMRLQHLAPQLTIRRPMLGGNQTEELVAMKE